MPVVRWSALGLVIGLLAVPLAAAQVPFDGRFEVDSAITWSGVPGFLAQNGSHGSLGLNQLAPLAGYLHQSDRASIIFDQSVHIAPPVPIVPIHSVPTHGPTGPERVAALRVRVLAVDQTAGLHLSLPKSGNLTGDASDCRLRPSAEWPIAFHGRSIQSTGDAYVEARCAAAALAALGEQRLWITGALLALSYMKAGPAGIWQPVEQEVDTRRSDSGSPRMIAIQSQRGGNTTVAGHELVVRTARLILTGAVSIPELPGELRWGDRTFTSPAGPAQAEGAFETEAPDNRTLTLHGFAWQAPPAWVGPGAGTLRIEPAGVLVVAAGLALVWVLVFLFTRIRRDKALDHELRRTIVEAVSANPGASVADVARLAQVRWTLARYHVGVLIRQGLLASETRGRMRILFLPQSTAAVAGRWNQRLRTPRAQALLKALQENPVRTQKELARLLGCTQPSVSELLRGMVADGLVDVESAGRRRVYKPATPPNPGV